MEQYYFTFYCDELCIDLECELEYDEDEPDDAQYCADDDFVNHL